MGEVMQPGDPFSPAEKQRQYRKRKLECVRLFRLPLHTDMVAPVLNMAGVPEGTDEEEAMQLLSEWLEDAAG